MDELEYRNKAVFSFGFLTYRCLVQNSKNKKIKKSKKKDGDAYFDAGCLDIA